MVVSLNLLFCNSNALQFIAATQLTCVLSLADIIHVVCGDIFRKFRKISDGRSLSNAFAAKRAVTIIMIINCAS